MSAGEILDWAAVTNTQRTVFPYSPGRPASPFFRTTQEWPEPADWPTDPTAEWEALILPEAAELQHALEPTLMWPSGTAATPGIAVDPAARALVAPLLFGLALWLLLAKPA